jgi:hypothetical protein
MTRVAGKQIARDGRWHTALHFSEQGPGAPYYASVERIIAMWRFSGSNGITEGFHHKMEMISRRAHGSRNFEHYRLRVLTQLGWAGLSIVSL